MKYLLQGLTMGLAYVAPIGLQNLFVINAALTHTRRRSLLTSLIVIFFDITLAFACFFGIGAIMERFLWLQMIILLAGSLIVISIGISLLRTEGADIKSEKSDLSLKKTICSACIVTWFNPQAIIDGTMMLGAFHVTLPPDQAITFILGVALASFTWFTGLSLFISLFSRHFNSKVLGWINRVSGAVVVFYGLKLLLHFFQSVGRIS